VRFAGSVLEPKNECVLVADPATGQYTLEMLGSKYDLEVVRAADPAAKRAAVTPVVPAGAPAAAAAAAAKPARPDGAKRAMNGGPAGASSDDDGAGPRKRVRTPAKPPAPPSARPRPAAEASRSPPRRLKPVRPLSPPLRPAHEDPVYTSSSSDDDGGGSARRAVHHDGGDDDDSIGSFVVSDSSDDGSDHANAGDGDNDEDDLL